MTGKDKAQLLNEAVVAVAMPRREWLLLETFLVVHELDGCTCPTLGPFTQSPQFNLVERLRQIKHFIIEAERREADRINQLEVE